jgi:hypothetical protein
LRRVVGREGTRSARRRRILSRSFALEARAVARPRSGGGEAKRAATPNRSLSLPRWNAVCAIASDGDAIPTKPPPQTPSLDGLRPDLIRGLLAPAT